MGARRHRHGFCTCATHVDRPWDRSEHWTAAEVDYLDSSYGRISDRAIAKRLGRSVTGIRLKAKRLHLHKRAAGFTAREVAEGFGVDVGLVSKVWIRRGLLKAPRAAFRMGPHRVYRIQDEDVDRFIVEHGQYVDIDRMPESPWRELAQQLGRWYSLPEVQRITGRNADRLADEMRWGRWPARKRGTHWFVHESTLPAIQASAGYHGMYASLERRERRLEHRRNVRKGVEAPTPLPIGWAA
jgi:hypothetical protein